jgi:hypothetical protein
MELDVTMLDLLSAEPSGLVRCDITCHVGSCQITCGSGASCSGTCGFSCSLTS